MALLSTKLHHNPRLQFWKMLMNFHEFLEEKKIIKWVFTLNLFFRKSTNAIDFRPI